MRKSVILAILTFLIVAPFILPVNAGGIELIPPSTGMQTLFCKVTEDEAQLTCDSDHCSCGAFPLSAEAINSIFGFSGRTFEDHNRLDNFAKEGTNFKISNETSGLAGSLVAGISKIVEQRPASGILAIEEGVNSLISPGVIQAQEASNPEGYFPGTGYELLRPIQGFWGWSLVVAYSMMIFIIIVIAFALLFRNRLDGGQVIQIQNALPNIVLAMILIPLSYPISGLFIDGLTLGSNIVWGAFFSESGLARDVYEQGQYREGLTQLRNNDDDYSNIRDGRGFQVDDPRVTPLGIRGAFIPHIAPGLKDVIIPITDTECEGDPDKCQASVSQSDPIMSATMQLVGFFNGKIIGPFIAAILAIITVVTAFRILWKLLKRYIFLLIMTPLSPFWFASVAIPGRGTDTMMRYIRVMASVTLSFLATYVMFLLTAVFASPQFQSGVPNFQTTQYSPPLLGFGGTQGQTINNSFIFTLIAAGIYFSIPGTIDAIIKGLGADTPLPEFITRPAKEFSSAARTAGSTPGVVYGLGKRGAGLAAAPVRKFGQAVGYFNPDASKNIIKDANKSYADKRAEAASRDSRWGRFKGRVGAERSRLVGNTKAFLTSGSSGGIGSDYKTDFSMNIEVEFSGYGVTGTNNVTALGQNKTHWSFIEDLPKGVIAVKIKLSSDDKMSGSYEFDTSGGNTIAQLKNDETVLEITSSDVSGSLGGEQSKTINAQLKSGNISELIDGTYTGEITVNYGATKKASQKVSVSIRDIDNYRREALGNQSRASSKNRSAIDRVGSIGS